MSEVPQAAQVMIIGKDARTDVMAEALSRSAHSPRLIGVSEFSAPGLLRRCDSFYGDVSLVDVDAVTRLAERHRPDLVVVGPEEPLAAGIVDSIEDGLGIPCFGPRQALARIEASKSWARELVDRHHIGANPEFHICRSHDEISDAVRKLGDFVVKPDGLTGGKGVKLSNQHFDRALDAVDYARELLDADDVVLIEELLEGEEFSLQSITDGDTVIHTPLVQDHKRAYDGDTGPNTGGMGSYSCADFSLPFLTADDVATAKAINERVVRAIRAETGMPYRGVLYGGFIATAKGVRLIEYNARFGDPEAMNVLTLLDGDFLDICWDVAHGSLHESDISFQALATVCRYLVPEGYPASVKHAGDEIQVTNPGADDDDAQLFWAAVRQVGDKVLLTGSRALACVGSGESLAEANANAAKLIDRVVGPLAYRTDIGSDSLLQRRIQHMSALRG